MIQVAHAPTALSRIDSAAAHAVVITPFLPYAALPLGANTNLPLSSIVATYLIVRFLRNSTILVYTVVALAVPFAATFVRSFVSPHQVEIAPYIAWTAYALPLPAMAAAVLVLRRRLVPLLSITIGVSSLVGLVQRAYLEQNVLPWQWYYWAPGYASINAQAREIANYNHRAFGLFPEPSFMAGTLVLTTLLLLALLVYWDLSYSWREVFALATVTPALLLSSSGSVVPTFVFLLAAAMAPMRKHLRKALFLSPVLIVLAGYVGITLLEERTGSSFNFSWYDRSASIVIALNEWVDSSTGFILGLGRGMINVYYRQHRMPLDKSEHYHEIVDIFSVLLRTLIENGVFGMALICLMSIPFFKFRRPASVVVQVGAWVSWVIVAGLTITYDSAFWLWGLPGAFLGLQLLPAVGLETTREATPNSLQRTGAPPCVAP